MIVRQFYGILRVFKHFLRFFLDLLEGFSFGRQTKNWKTVIQPSIEQFLAQKMIENLKKTSHSTIWIHFNFYLFDKQGKRNLSKRLETKKKTFEKWKNSNDF